MGPRTPFSKMGCRAKVWLEIVMSVEYISFFLLCQSEVTLSDVPSSASDLPWLHIIHHLLLCPAEPGRPPLFQFSSDMLLLTSIWPHTHRGLGILFADLHPSAPASSYTPSAPLYTDFSACFLIHLDLRIHLQGFQSLKEIAVGYACSHGLFPTQSVSLSRDSFPTSCTYLFPPLALQTPLLPVDGPPASVNSVLLGSFVVSPQPFPRSRISYCSPQVTCVSGALD
jgi:hypothetical protein